jgi:hypothetical protein
VAVVTLAQLIDRTRQRADQVSSGFVTDSEIINWINVYRREYEDLLVRTFGADYSATSATFSATAATENNNLSALTGGTFYKLQGLDVADAASPTGWRDVKPYNFHDRNKIRTVGFSLPVTVSNPDVRYRVWGPNLVLRPVPTSTMAMKLYWTPQTPTMSSTTDSFDDNNGWSELIVIDAAIAIKDKEESDTSVLQADRQRLVQRITSMATNRDAGEPMTIGDVTGSFDSGLPWPRY